MLRNIATIAIALFVLGAATAAVNTPPQPRTFFKEHVGLSDSEMQMIDQGQVVTKVLPSGDTKYECWCSGRCT